MLASLPRLALHPPLFRLAWVAVVTAVVIAPYRAASAGWAEAPETFVVLRDGTPGGMPGLIRAFEAAGGHVAVVTSGRAAVVFADDATLADPSLAGRIEVAERGSFARPDALSPDPSVCRAAAVWNAARELARQSALEPVAPLTSTPPFPDAGPLPYAPPSKTPPPQALASSHLPFGAGYYDTSEFMAGSVAVGVWLLEAPPSSTFHWSVSNVDITLAGVQSGLANWVRKGGAATFLTFFLDIHRKVPVSGTPIQNPISMDQSWVDQFLGNAGWPGANAFERCFAYNNSIRDAFNTNWAYSIVIVDSEPVVNQGLFSAGGYAFAYYGGPYVWMARYSTWAFNSTSYFAAVPMHESGHIFQDTDEYDSTLQYGGYLNAPDDTTLPQCIMNQNDTTRVCPLTRAQLGWRDLDGDGVIEPLDAPPTASLAPSGPKPLLNPTPTIHGAASVATIPNLNPNSRYFPAHAITVATLDAVQCRVDAGQWTAAVPLDGAFDGYAESFQWIAPTLAAGTHIVEARAHDSVGNWSTSFPKDTVVVTVAVGVGPVAAAFRLLAPQPNPLSDRTEIRFMLPEREAVDAEVVDLAGRRVRTLAADRECASGLNLLDWDGRDDAGRRVAVGVYLMRVRAGGEAGMQRVVVSR